MKNFKSLKTLRYSDQGTAVAQLSSLVVSSAKALEACVDITDKDAVLSVEGAILTNLAEQLSNKVGG